MAQRSVSEIMAEGQKLTLEHAELLRKQILGTITPEESTRKSVLEGYLLGLMGEAQAQGVGVGVGTGYGQAEVQSDDLGLDDDEDGDPYADEDGEFYSDSGVDGRFW